MAIAETSQSRLSIIPEVTYGTTPATPAFTNLRFTGESLKHNRGNVTSNEIRADRNVSDLIQVSGGAEGAINFELSYGAFDTLIEAALCGTWSTNVLENGVTKRSFTLEKKFEQGTTDTYMGYTGMVVNTMSLNISAQEIVTGSFSFMGKGGYVDDAIITGATYTDGAANEIMSAGLNFADLAITGGGSPKLTGLTLEINNNARMQPVVGSIDSVGIGYGRFIVTGTATMYFENKDAYELFLAGTASDLSFTLDDGENSYEFSIPKLKFSDGDVPIGGADQDVVLTLPFQGLYDATLGATIEVTRVPAV